LAQNPCDTIILQGKVRVEISTNDTVYFPDYFEHQSQIDSLGELYDNAELYSLAVEKFLLGKSNPGISIEGTTRIVKLKNGKKIMLTPLDSLDEGTYTFEKAFKNNCFLLFRVQWFEGNNYFLINTETGEKTYTIGRVYFSKNNKYMISINDDIEAAYSDNGFQLFAIGRDKCLKEIWNYYPVWAPEKIKWINDKSLIVKGYYLAGDKWERKAFYKKVKINLL
jgi:hypothetical protein